MAEKCHKCGDELLPADNFKCEMADHICPTCAPDWVLCRATSHTDLKPSEYGYKTS